MRAVRSSGIRIDPDPAVEGQPVTITVVGTGPWYVAQDPSGDLVEIKPDANGEVEMTTPGAGGGTFTVMNGSEPYVNDFFDVVSQEG